MPSLSLREPEKMGEKMITAWVCPQHGSQKVRIGKHGPFCSAKLSNGEWCPERPPKAAKPAQETLATPAVAPAAAPTTDLGARYAHALAFAGQIYQGQGDEAVGNALKLAETIYNGWPR